MARRHARPPAQRDVRLTQLRETCVNCGERLWVASHAQRTLMTFCGLVQLTLVVRRCRNQECVRYHLPYRAEEEGAWALPHGECGLDIMTVIGQVCSGEHRSIPEIHQRLTQRGVSIALRTVTDVLERDEALVALHLADEERLQERLKQQGQVILAIDGMQPDVGHDVLWVLRDGVSGEVLLARALLSRTQKDLATLLREVTEAFPVPIRGVISDGQKPIRKAVAQCVPGGSHQLCQFHSLREAATPMFEADRHAKTERKKLVRGLRPIERALEGQEDPESQAMHGSCLAVRSAFTDDGRPPFHASGLTLHDRLTQIADSLARVTEKRGRFLQPSKNCTDCSRGGCSRPRPRGLRLRRRLGSSTRQPTCWPITKRKAVRPCASAPKPCWRRCASTKHPLDHSATRSTPL